MPEKRCSTCQEPLSLCQCAPPDPPETFARVVALQSARREADRARRIAALTPLLSYAEVNGPLPRGLQEDIKALCANVYAVFFPPRPYGGRPRDIDEVNFRQCYWEAYHKVRAINLRCHRRGVGRTQVAKELLMSLRTFKRNRERYRLSWPPPSPH